MAEERVVWSRGTQAAMCPNCNIPASAGEQIVVMLANRGVVRGCENCMTTPEFREIAPEAMAEMMREEAA